MNTSRFNGSFTCAAIAIAITSLAVLMTLPSLLGAAFSPSPDDPSVDAQYARLLERHADAMETDAERFSGRSVFFKPPAPPRPRAPLTRTPAPITPRDPAPAPTPIVTRPARYDGPGVKGFDGDAVWFANGLQIAIGEEADGIAVLEMHAPWYARLGYQGAEFDVYLFALDDSFVGDATLARSDVSMPGLLEAGSEEEKAAWLADWQRRTAEEAKTVRPTKSPAAASARNRRGSRGRGLTPAQRRAAVASDPTPVEPDE